MFELILEIIAASLLSYGIGYLCGTVPIIGVIGVIALCVMELITSGLVAIPVVACIVIAAFFGMVAKRDKAAQEEAQAEAERKHREAVAQLGPAVVPLSESELQSLMESIYTQFLIWCDSTYDHTWVVITFEPEHVRFSAVGKYQPYTGFSEYYPYSHKVFGSSDGMNYDESKARAAEHWAYRRQVAQRVLDYIRSRDVSHLSDLMWIDDCGDILSSSQH